MTFLHGISVTETATGSALLATVATAVIGLIATAPLADAGAFPLDRPVMVIDLHEAIGKAGATGTLAPALTAIAAKVRCPVVVVRVAPGADDEATELALIGTDQNGQKTGMQALLPRKLKQMMMFIDGTSYAGETQSVTLPKLDRKLEGYRGGGMARGAKIDMGAGDDLDLEHSYGGPIRDVLRQYGNPSLTGVQLRFVGTYQHDHTGEIDTIEIVVRGRHEEIDRGEQKVGEAGEFKVKTACAYYKEVWNGVTEVEIDIVGMVEIVNGVDLMAPHRAAMGLI